MLIKLLRYVQNAKDPTKRKQELFQLLSKGQSPDTFLITCSDSRVALESIFGPGAAPGNIFTLRTAGYIMPPANVVSGEGGTFEYGIGALPVKDIIVCGHSDCGAIKAKMALMGTDEKAKKVLVETYPILTTWIQKMSIENTECSIHQSVHDFTNTHILEQVQNLKTYNLKENIKIHAWNYDIETGEIYIFNEKQGRFLTFDEELKLTIEQRKINVVEQVVEKYLNKYLNPVTANDFFTNFSLITKLQTNLQPIWDDIKEAIAEELFNELGHLYDGNMEKELLESAMHVKPAKLQSYKTQILKSEGYELCSNSPLYRFSQFTSEKNDTEREITQNSLKAKL